VALKRRHPVEESSLSDDDSDIEIIAIVSASSSSAQPSRNYSSEAHYYKLLFFKFNILSFLFIDPPSTANDAHSSLRGNYSIYLHYFV